MEEANDAFGTCACDVSIGGGNRECGFRFDVDPLVEISVSVEAQQEAVRCHGIACATGYAA